MRERTRVRVPVRLRSRRVAAVGAAVASLAAVAAAAPLASSGSGQAPTKVYIVQLSAKPAAAYTGGVSGLAATRPAKGHKIDARASNVVRYRAYLKTGHDALAARVGGVQRLYDYTVVFNGFAARMTAAQAAKLAHTDGVASVTADEVRTADTITTPEFLGLSLPGGLWDQLGGPGRKGAGRGIVIGDIDSGIWPESASFAPLVKPGKLPATWHGTCQTGQMFDASDCSNKLIGARYYDAGQGGDAAITAKFPLEYVSARDSNGHGSHTASTAGGDNDVPFVINGNLLGNGSGMAPNARIAAYKALWNTGSTASGTTSDLVAAINDAVADGVDVINYSISGSRTSNLDPVEVAFLNAAAAGVFVAASAGNDGPGATTVAHNSPWLTTVAAGTHDRAFQATVTLGNGATYTGLGIGAAVPSSPARPLERRRLRRRRYDRQPAVLLEHLDARARGVPRPGQGRRQDRGLRPRHERPGRQEQGGPRGRRRRHDPGQHVAELAERGLPLGADGARRRRQRRGHQGVRRRHRRSDRGARRGPSRARRRGPEGRRVLVARPVDRRQRRPAQAGHHGSGRRRPRGRRSADPRRPELRLRVRHLHVEPAHRGHRGAHPAAPSEVVADGDQVGPDDQRVDARQRWQPDHHRLGRPRGPARLRLGPGHAELGRRPRPGLRLERRPLGAVPVRQRPARSERPELRCGRVDRSERPEHPEHRHRRARRHPDRDPHGHQRRQEGDLHGERQRPGRRRRDGLPVHPQGALQRDGHLHGDLHPHQRRVRHVRHRLAHLERRHAPGAQHDRGAARAARGARRGQRDGHQRLDGHRRDDRLQRHADRRGRRPGARQRHHVEPDQPVRLLVPGRLRRP